MDDFLCTSMFHIFCDNIGPMYPLIFSPEYPKKFSELTRYIPYIVESIQNIIMRSSDSGQEETNVQSNEIKQICLANIQAMGCKTSILRPIIPHAKSYLDTDTGTDLMVALYSYFKNTMPTPRYPKMTTIIRNNNNQDNDSNNDTETPYDSVLTLWTDYKI